MNLNSINLSNIVLGIIIIFFILLIAKQFFPKRIQNKLCVLCITISLTWISLLVLYWKGLFNDAVIISILIGQSTVGIFYLIERKVKEKFTVFRLPFLLTLILIAYSLINGSQVLQDIRGILNVLIIIAILWVIFILFFLYKDNKKVNKIVNNLIECCKNW